MHHLDDANVGKFTKMIKQFSEESQFIIVTHNKMTMSTVDIIYGVTMQEAGVSKLVAVDFRNLERTGSSELKKIESRKSKDRKLKMAY